MKYQVRAADVEAVQFKSDVWEIVRFTGGSARGSADGYLFVETSAQILWVGLGDWVVRKPEGTLFVCKSDIFPVIYEPVPTEDAEEVTE